MAIRPIKTESDYEDALGMVEQLWGAEDGSAAGDTLDILLVLIEPYEAAHHPIDPPDPIEAIKFRMEQQNLSRKALEGVIGSRGRVSEVLNRRRGLSLTMIRNLHSQLHIPLESLIAEAQVDR